MRKVNTDMLILAREYRGLTQQQLAELVDIPQSAISKYENGILGLPQEHLAEIARVLDCPEALFTITDYIDGPGSSCMFHRKRQSLRIGELRRIHAFTILSRIRISRLLRSADLSPIYPFPRWDVNEFGGPAEIAELLRRSWRIPLGPIKNLILLIENAGGIVMPVRFNTRQLDAISQWPVGLPPIFFINSDMPFERIRFSLAHELGHLVMHEHFTPDQEVEADQFASSFLMPAKAIKPELQLLTLPGAVQMKSSWRVSMQAIIRRAYDLGEISESKYRRLFTEISKLGYRLREPAPIIVEEPQTLHRLIQMHLDVHRYTINELCELLAINEGEFRRDYMTRVGSHITMV